MAFRLESSNLHEQPACGKFDHAALAEAIYEGGVAAMMQADPKKLGKEKKPDQNPVSLIFPDP